MHVTNWTKWTSAKKKAITILYLLGMILVFTIEQASAWWGVLGIVFALVGAFLVGTIKHDEW